METHPFNLQTTCSTEHTSWGRDKWGVGHYLAVLFGVISFHSNLDATHADLQDTTGGWVKVHSEAACGGNLGRRTEAKLWCSWQSSTPSLAFPTEALPCCQEEQVLQLPGMGQDSTFCMAAHSTSLPL